jgi:hypothetical protein
MLPLLFALLLVGCQVAAQEEPVGEAQNSAAPELAHVDGGRCVVVRQASYETPLVIGSQEFPASACVAFRTVTPLDLVTTNARVDARLLGEFCTCD